MFYFLTNKFEYNLSGIEHAQVYRTKIFEELNESSKIVTFDYTPESDRFLSRHHISRNISYNMFDFWQKSLTSDLVKNSLGEILAIDRYPGSIRIEYYNERSTAYNFKGDRIGKVTFLNQNDEIEFIDTWDIRGFRSLREVFKEGIAVERNWYTPEQKIVLRETNGGIFLTSSNPQFNESGVNEFRSWKTLKASWLDYISKHDTKAVFFVDRGEYVTPIILEMKNTKVPTYVVLHSAHTRDRNDPVNSALNDVRALELANKSRFNGYIASTPEQARDYQIKTGFPTFAIPVSFVESVQNEERHAGSNLVYLSRISREKRVEDAIKILDILRRSIQDIKLTVYGYVTDASYNQELHNLVKNLGLEKFVNLLPYNENKKEIFSDKNIFMMTSEYEGFNMSMVEAASYGIPTVSYDVKYGPKYIIDNVGGKLVENHNLEEFAKNIIDVRKDYEVLSKNVKESVISKFGKEEVKKIWNEFLNDEVKNFRSQKLIYFLKFKNTYNALEPANDAILEFSKKVGYTEIPFPADSADEKKFSNIGSGDTVLLPYPSFFKTINSRLKYDFDLVKNIKANGAKLILLVEDSLILRELTEFSSNEFKIFEYADVLMVLTEEMKTALSDIGFKKKLILQGPYPFLNDKMYVDNNVKRIKEKIEDNSNNKSLLYAGNLDKGSFLKEFGLKTHKLFLFGNVTSKNDIVSNDNVVYFGGFEYHKLNYIIENFKGFGLVWDGGNLAMETSAGRYTRYNFPYKAVQYLALGIPLIAWEGSAIGKIIVQGGFGFTISNLDILEDVLDKLSDSSIEVMRKKARIMGNKIKDGGLFLDSVINAEFF